MASSFVVVVPVVRRRGWDYLGAALARTKLQLCGKLVVELAGRRVEEQLPGRQGRALLAFLTVNRNRAVTRDEVVSALWPDGRDAGLAPLLSKLRRVVPVEGLALRLPADAWVDVEAAVETVHRAESAVVQRDFHGAWGPAQVAMFVSGRLFLAGHDADWIEDVRRSLAAVRLRALEAYAQAVLGIGGTELAAAVRAGRELTRLEPYRESGYRVLMEALAAEGNTAEALRVFDDLRRLLHDELGAAPSPPTQELHRRLLG
jgi:SARP family transcriptional regulator, regulator of embCAB operon